MAEKKVLITGMSGLIGGIVRERLEGTYALSALNRRPVEGIECYQADIADLDSIQPAFEGVDVVVHLGGKRTRRRDVGRSLGSQYHWNLQCL